MWWDPFDKKAPFSKPVTRERRASFSVKKWRDPTKPSKKNSGLFV
jgi:hypothetical protein